MLIATKGNRQTVIDEKEVKSFTAQGYDITDETGKVVASPENKVVPFAKYSEALKENAELKKELAKLKKGGSE